MVAAAAVSLVLHVACCLFVAVVAQSSRALARLLFLLRYLFWPIEATNHKLHFTILIDQNAVVGVGVFEAFVGSNPCSLAHWHFLGQFSMASFRSGPWLFALAGNYYYYYLFEIKYH